MRERYAIIIASIIIIISTAAIGAVSNPTREDLPPPPINVTATPRDQEVRLDWDLPPGFTGNDISGITVLRGPSSDNVENIVASLGPFDEFFIDGEQTPLVNGRTYYYSIRIINESGSSNPSTPVSAVPRGPCSPPTNFTSTYESEAVHLSWNDPDDSNGSPVEFYSVFKGTSDNNLSTREDVGTDKTYSDMGLENGVPYFYQVCAVTAAGDGRRTNVKSVTPRTVPEPPFNLSSSKGDETVTLLWNYSLEDGGAAIEGHKIYRGPDVDNLEHVATIGYTKTFTDTGLENGITYYYSVTAYNSEGESDFASATMVTPLGPPGKPQNMTLKPGNTEIVVVWEPPEEDGGTPILGYYIYMNKHGEDMELGADAGDVLEHTVTDLENNQIYYFQVRAYNTEGEGPGSNTEMIRPEPLPKTPENFRVIDLEGEVRLAWTKPSYTGEYPYENILIYRGITEDSLELYQNISYEHTQFYDEDVEVGSVYYYELKIISEIGEGLATPTMMGRPYGRPSVPQNFKIETDVGKAYLSWEQPDFFGGRVIDGFKIFRGTARDSLTSIGTVPGTQNFYNDTELTNGVTYYYRISAFNVEMEGNSTDIVEARPTGPPGVPKSTAGVVDQRNGTVILSWSEPSSDGGKEITKYKVYRGPERDNLTEIGEVETDEEFIDEDVEDGLDYYYSISAINEDGEGPMTMVFYVQMPEAESTSDDDGTGALLWIVLVIMVVLIMVLIIIVAVVQSNKKKKEEEKREDIPQLEESESEREERLIQERRKMMAAYTDVSISTDDAHAIDHEQHDLSYEQLYGSSSSGEQSTPPMEVVSSSPVDESAVQEGYLQSQQAGGPQKTTPQYEPPQNTQIPQQQDQQQ